MDRSEGEWIQGLEGLGVRDAAAAGPAQNRVPRTRGRIVGCCCGWSSNAYDRRGQDIDFFHQAGQAVMGRGTKRRGKCVYDEAYMAWDAHGSRKMAGSQKVHGQAKRFHLATPISPSQSLLFSVPLHDSHMGSNRRSSGIRTRNEQHVLTRWQADQLEDVRGSRYKVDFRGTMFVVLCSLMSRTALGLPILKNPYPILDACCETK